jgi:hypothetical protein
VKIWKPGPAKVLPRSCQGPAKVLPRSCQGPAKGFFLSKLFLPKKALQIWLFFGVFICSIIFGLA